MNDDAWIAHDPRPAGGLVLACTQCGGAARVTAHVRGLVHTETDVYCSTSVEVSADCGVGGPRSPADNLAVASGRVVGSR